MSASAAIDTFMKDNTAPDLVVGIDFGTTNSAIAAVLDGKVTVIPVAGQPLMPSAVGIDPNGKLVVGQAAKNQSVAAPDATVLSVKRLMGTEDPVPLGGKSYRPEEIAAIILGQLKKAAESHLGHPVTRAVITVPAFYNERQRQATQDAGRLAGIEVLRIINEPTAAALAYGAGRSGQDGAETLLVYDLGGGTFDVSLVSVEDGIVEVRASHGDTRLGGDDFDELLAQLAAGRFADAQPGAELDPATRRRLRAVMEKTKIALSDAPYAAVREEYLTPTAHLDTEIARQDYETLIEPLLEKTLGCLQQTMADGKITAAQVDKILLVGGATRTPAVQDLLLDRLGREARHEIDPDLIVAMGAAIQGAALAGQPAPAILVDITAHTYSIGVLVDAGGPIDTEGCAPIIRRGTALPARKAEVFVTSHDNQEDVRIEVYQGEGSYPDQNTEIGNFSVKGLSRVPAGNAVVVTFQIDLNGLLTVTATEKRTGLAKSVTIDTAGQHRINLDAARTNLAALFQEHDPNASFPDDPAEYDGESEGDPAGAADCQPPDPAHPESPAELLANAKSLRRRANTLLDAPLPDADAAAIRSELDHIAQAIRESDWPRLADATRKLSDLLFYLED